MEKFTITAPSTQCKVSPRLLVCGVVSSGNLEAMLGVHQQSDMCEIVVSTAAHGFKPVWENVLTDFAARHAAGGLRIAINDAGATPAVVSLRLDQLMAEVAG